MSATISTRHTHPKSSRMVEAARKPAPQKTPHARGLRKSPGPALPMPSPEAATVLHASTARKSLRSNRSAESLVSKMRELAAWAFELSAATRLLARAFEEALPQQTGRSFEQRYAAKTIRAGEPLPALRSVLKSAFASLPKTSTDAATGSARRASRKGSRS